MPTWPASIPFFADMAPAARSGQQGGVIRSNMDIGPAKVRRRTSAMPSRRSAETGFLTKAELAAFESFFANDLAQGALAFDATDPMDCTLRSFRFLESYSVSRHGSAYKVAAELEIMP